MISWRRRGSLCVPPPWPRPLRCRSPIGQCCCRRCLQLSTGSLLIQPVDPARCGRMRCVELETLLGFCLAVLQLRGFNVLVLEPVTQITGLCVRSWHHHAGHLVQAVDQGGGAACLSGAVKVNLTAPRTAAALFRRRSISCLRGFSVSLLRQIGLARLGCQGLEARLLPCPAEFRRVGSATRPMKAFLLHRFRGGLEAPGRRHFSYYLGAVLQHGIQPAFSFGCLWEYIRSAEHAEVVVLARSGPLSSGAGAYERPGRVI